MTIDETVFKGGCLCGSIRYIAKAEPIFPHLCSCTTCQSWSGAPTVAWVEFPLDSFQWVGSGGEPSYFSSSAKTQRGHCPKCGSNICAVDEGYDNISIVMGSLDTAEAIIPDIQHSFEDEKPNWWRAEVQAE